MVGENKHTVDSIGNKMKAIYLGVGLLWVLLAGWFLAPLIAWGLAWVLLTGFRGYGQGMLLLSMISAASRWLFLVVAALCLHSLAQNDNRFSFKQLASYALTSLAIFTVLYSVKLCLCFRACVLSATTDPVKIVSFEVFPDFSLASLLVMASWLELVVKTLVEQEPEGVLYVVYLVLKSIYTYFIIERADRQLSSFGGYLDRFTRLLAVSVIVLAGLIGVPLSGIDEISRGIASFFIAYEAAWLLFTVPVSILVILLLKWLKRTGVELAHEQA
ncbi:MAG: hypothetical protein KatS3mg016_1301 [Fimbriimonadales bacterium]|nr:MAG: hypothetical protein KatS3mg016_1301 [Fimbriimonadales bacterium]